MDKKHKGAHSELLACAWLLAEGYEVFRNVSPHGTTDLVAIKHDLMFRIDVKSATSHTHKDGTIVHYCAYEAPKGIRVLAVLSNGGFIWQDQLPQYKDSLRFA